MTHRQREHSDSSSVQGLQLHCAYRVSRNMASTGLLQEPLVSCRRGAGQPGRTLGGRVEQWKQEESTGRVRLMVRGSSLRRELRLGFRIGLGTNRAYMTDLQRV